MDEEKKVITHFQVSQDFESLMNGLALQTEKMLHFENSIFFSKRCFDKNFLYHKESDFYDKKNLPYDKDQIVQKVTVGCLGQSVFADGTQCSSIQNDGVDENTKVVLDFQESYEVGSYSSLGLTKITEVQRNNDPTTIVEDLGCHKGVYVSEEKPMHRKEQVERVWALFETDELGNPEKKIAGSVKISLDLSVKRQGYSIPLGTCELPDQNMALDYPGNILNFSLPIQLMVLDWEASDALRIKWQHYITQVQTSLQFEWKVAEYTDHGDLSAEKEGDLCNLQSKMASESTKEHQGSHMVLISERGECGIIKEENSEEVDSQVEDSKEDTKEMDIVLSTYRLHVENPEDDFFDKAFSAPLILNKTLLEQKLNCCGKELQNVSFLNLNHEGLSSLGELVLSHWCPKTRIFTADMNRLSSVKSAFVGYEETLEQLSLKDNFLCDLNGLECLHRLQVIHLDGNYILQLSASAWSMLHRELELELEGPVGHETRGQKKSEAQIPAISRNIKCLPPSCWPSLKEIGLSCNRISKVERLGLLCPILEVLDLGSNNLVSLGGPHESALLGLKCLRVLDVGQNKLKGKSLWEGLNHCPFLVSLVASRNRLRELPTHVGSVFLRELWLNGNSIKHFSCTAWMPNLQRLYLQDNEIDTVMPIWGFPALEGNQVELGKHLQMLEERKAAMVEIAKDWGFTHEKTALQLMRALENTRRRAEAPKANAPDSQTRFKAFITKCGKHDNITTKSSSYVNLDHVNDKDKESSLCKKMMKTIPARSKGGSSQERRYVTASVTTLCFDQAVS